MKPNHHSAEQIIKILDQALTGKQTVASLCRDYGIAENTFYRWRKTYSGMAGNDVQRQSLAREFIDHGQEPQRRTIGQGILHKIIGPDMAWVGCLQALWSQASYAFAQHTAHLQTMVSPQPTHAFLIDRLRSIDQDTDPTIPIARVAGGQFLDLGQQGCIVRRVRGILERRPMDLNQGARSAHRQATCNQELNSRALLG